MRAFVMDTTLFRQSMLYGSRTVHRSLDFALVCKALAKESAAVQLEIADAFARETEAGCQLVCAMWHILWCAKVVAIEL